jgi:FkbM family methyltransferase
MSRSARLLVTLLKKKMCVKTNATPPEKSISKYIDPKVDNLFVIDVGANRGRYYDELSSIFPVATIKALLIEPIPVCALELRSKYKNTNLVLISQTVISDIEEMKEFHINSYDETSSLLNIRKEIKELRNINTQTKETTVVATKTLDNLVEEFPFLDRIIDILKIDVQGSEDRVLRGAGKTLKRTKFIWIEVSFKVLYEDSCLFSDIHSFLSNSDFVLLEIADGHRSPENELLQANCLYKNMNIK